MTTIVKRKLKIKWKNLLIFLLFTGLLIFGLIELVVCVVKVVTTPKKIEKPKTVEKQTKKEETKLDKLDNINKEIDYFNNDYIDKYISYKEKHTEMPNIQIIKNVNMNLDRDFYEDPIKAKNLNTIKILVNKYYYLDNDFVPDNLETISNRYALNNMKMVNVAKEAFEEMAKAAKKENLNIIAMSCYRSYDYQVNLYNKYTKADGQDKADTYAGRPGHSEHQTGLAVDVYNGKENYTNFERTKEFDWMKEHAVEYGFILRYPKGKETETGYEYESWHYRYVGKEVATYIKEHDISYEEYYATIIKDW
jgi:D-alanyl-D-alanine carboxypeptidase